MHCLASLHIVIVYGTKRYSVVFETSMTESFASFPVFELRLGGGMAPSLAFPVLNEVEERGAPSRCPVAKSQPAELQILNF